MASQYIPIPLEGTGAAAGVDSFNGRVGVVVSQNADYAASQITNTPAGNISATEVQAAINELDAEKQATITGGASSIVTANLTIDRALVSNGSGKVAVSPTTAAELAFSSGVTSALQTQLNAKEASFSVLPVSKGGTNSGVALANNFAMHSSGGAVVESATTSAELGYLSGVTSALQTQINGKQPLDSDLTALAGLATTGMLTRTGAGTAETRTITGTASQILVVDGDGVAANPTISLINTAVAPATYTYATVTVDAQGRITAAASGTPSTSPSMNVESIIYNEFTDSANASYHELTNTNTGTGSGVSTSNVGIDTTEKAIGVKSLNTGTTTTGRAALHSDTAAYATGSSQLTEEIRAMLPDLGTVGDPHSIAIGFIDDLSATPGHIDGAYFFFQANGVNTLWQTVTSQASTRTTTTTASTVLGGFFQIFTVIINEAGTSVAFYIDGVLVATHVTNIPTGTQRFGRGMTNKKSSLGTTNQPVYIDYEQCTITWSAGR